MSGLPLAKRLLAAGIPVVAVGPGDIPRQKGWQRLTADQCDLSLYQPKTDALAMVGGHGIDAVDVDPKNGGNVDSLPPFKSYGQTTTPSGGAHYIVPSSGFGKISPLDGEHGHVGDYIGGHPDGTGRGFLFLPGSRRSKYPDGGYVETAHWDVEGCLAATCDPDLVAALEKAGGGRESSTRDHYVYDGPDRDSALGPAPAAQAMVAVELARLDECEVLGWDGPPWDDTTFKVACNLIELGNSGWTGYDLDSLHEMFLIRAPVDAEFGPVKHAQKWESALLRIGNGGIRPHWTPEEDFGPVEDEATEPEQDGKFDRDVEREARLLRVREAARELVARERRADVQRPTLVRLDAFLEEQNDPESYRVDQLWPSHGRIVLAAQNKSGKTTLTGNLMRSLVDGDPFLDQFRVQRAARVVLLDNELSPNMIRRWLRDQGIVNADRVDLVSLRGRLSTFNILDPVVRAEWAAALGKADVLIFDCLRPALDALGLSEDKESGRFLEALDELTAEAGIAEFLLVHHMGHSNERSRGDSRLEDWPDAKWKLVREDPDDPVSDRYFSAFGRDVDFAESRLAFNPLDRHLVIAGGSRGQSKVNQMRREVLAFIVSEPGCSQSAIEHEITGDRTKIRETVKALRRDGEIRIEKKGQAFCHFAESTNFHDENVGSK